LRVCLLTEHATDFFAEKFGFRPVPREGLPPEVQISSEYQRFCGRAVAMALEIS
jgi:N-acetylglutamate synthase-like GNAT family acetyltransferase